MLLALALGLMFVSANAVEEARSCSSCFGCLALALGVGFIVSAVGVLRAVATARSASIRPPAQIMRDVTLSDIERLRAQRRAADVVLEMDEDAFRAFYDRTARALWAISSRDHRRSRSWPTTCCRRPTIGSCARAVEYESEAHRRNSLFRIATNLVRDNCRRARVSRSKSSPPRRIRDRRRLERGDDASGSADLQRAMAKLRPRERELLWLAYAQGSSHREIADRLGLKTGSIKLLLFRARRRLADLLRGHGYGH